jgi:hypothetical protein
MRIFLLLVWLLIPIVAVAYHLGPGQERQTLDNVAAILVDVKQHAAREQWNEVVEKCDAALAKLPKDRLAESRQLVLERAKARMLAKQLPVAHEELRGLVDDLSADPSDPKLLEEAQASLANARYYLTWLMRLEGKPAEEWEPEIEASRQTWRMLAEQAAADGDEAEANRYREDLESTIRLARMELTELQGLPLPSQ